MGWGIEGQVVVVASNFGTKRAELLAAILRWARQAEGVEALIQTGSLVRRDHLADEHSDLDVEIIASDPEMLEEDDGWLTEIGETITVLHLDEDQDWSTRLAIFENGVKVDFTLAGRERVLEMIEEGRLDPLYERGYRVVVDKTGIADRLPAPGYAPPVPELPGEAHFVERVEEFWFEAFHVPKYLQRGELFLVKQRDWTMKQLLLEMMEWHAVAVNADPVDVWHNGTRIRQWSDPATLQALDQAFGRFDAEDADRAYRVTIDLYDRLAREVAERAGFAYPDAVERKIRALA